MKIAARTQADYVNNSNHSPALKKEEKYQPQRSIEEYHADFTRAYLFGDRQEAIELLPFIEVNYDDGYFLVIAARKGDVEMLTALLEKGAKAGIQDALGAAASNIEDDRCIDLLVKHGANPLLLRGTDACLHPRIKALVS